MFLFCHVISQDHVNQESCNSLGRSAAKLVTTLSSFVATDTLVLDV